jgi:hypothetical protein
MAGNDTSVSSDALAQQELKFANTRNENIKIGVGNTFNNYFHFPTHINTLVMLCVTAY